MMTKYSLVYAMTRSDGTAVRMKAQAFEDDGKTPILHGTPDLVDTAVVKKVKVQVEEDGKTVEVEKDEIVIEKRPPNRPPVEAEHEIVSATPLKTKEEVWEFVKSQGFADALDAKITRTLELLGKAPAKPGVNLSGEAAKESDIR
jgi:hypothetical protein